MLRYRSEATGYFQRTKATFLSENSHRFLPACLRPAYARDRARNEGTPWLRSPRGLSTLQRRERGTTLSGTTNCLALDSGSLLRASGATSSSIEREVAHVATQLGFTGPGRQRLRARRRKSNSVGSLGEMILPKSANSITRQSP